MDKKFIITGIFISVINLLLNAAAYFFVLKDIYKSFPAVSEEFTMQLSRQPGQIIIWALVVTSLAMGFLITMVIKWSGAKTFVSGIKNSFIFSLLFWASVNFGLYASSNYFSLEAVFADYILSVTAMTISGTIAARMVGEK